MAEPTLNFFNSEDLVPEKYVRELSQNCIGGPELVRVRNKIQSLSEQTSGNLKKNVYQNYMQFIDTAKEISHLESEMYQLSHLLSEQKSLLSSLSNTSILGDESLPVTETGNNNEKVETEDESKLKLAAISEKVDGCVGLLDVPGRTLLHEGDLLELDVVENTLIKVVRGYLFSDGLMITSKQPNSRGPVRYKYEVIYELGSLAVVNVRDLGNIKYAFKVLAFPDTRLFQCSSTSTKKEWLDKFDLAKKARLTQEQQKRESVADKSPSRSVSVDSPSGNPFDEAEEDIKIHPEWFLDVPEELDVCVAERHFEEALSLLTKAKDYIANYTPEQKDHVVTDVERKIEQRYKGLTEVLMKELEVNPDKSLQGGLRAARKAVRLLNQLGRSTQSCDLFLKLCSSMLKAQCKRVKREGSAIMYIRYLSSVVFTNMCHMTEEFLRAFPNSPSCASAYIVWVSGELRLFTSHFIKQVFMPQTSLSTLKECVELVRDQCRKLCTYGVDLCYQLDGALRTPITKALHESRDKIKDSIKLKAAEDKWIPSNYKSKSGIARALQEYAEIGLKLDSYVTGDCWLQLTPNTLAFTKLFLSLFDDCLKLKTSELLYTIDETLYEVFLAQMKYVESSLRNESQLEQKELIQRNADFLLGSLLQLTQEKYKAETGFECTTLEKLVKECSGIGASVANKNVYKYSSNEYL